MSKEILYMCEIRVDELFKDEAFTTQLHLAIKSMDSKEAFMSSYIIPGIKKTMADLLMFGYELDAIRSMEGIATIKMLTNPTYNRNWSFLKAPLLYNLTALKKFNELGVDTQLVMLPILRDAIDVKYVDGLQRHRSVEGISSSKIATLLEIDHSDIKERIMKLVLKTPLNIISVNGTIEFDESEDSVDVAYYLDVRLVTELFRDIGCIGLLPNVL